MTNDIFESAVRTAGDLVGIFEFDSGGGYFYLFDLTQPRGSQARAALRVNASGSDIEASHVEVRWSAAQDVVGLYIGDQLWAAFDQHGRKYGGDYDALKSPSIPSAISERFRVSSMQRELRAS